MRCSSGRPASRPRLPIVRYAPPEIAMPATTVGGVPRRDCRRAARPAGFGRGCSRNSTPLPPEALNRRRRRGRWQATRHAFFVSAAAGEATFGASSAAAAPAEQARSTLITRRLRVAAVNSVTAERHAADQQRNEQRAQIRRPLPDRTCARPAIQPPLQFMQRTPLAARAGGVAGNRRSLQWAPSGYHISRSARPRGAGSCSTFDTLSPVRRAMNWLPRSAPYRRAINSRSALRQLRDERAPSGRSPSRGSAPLLRRIARRGVQRRVDGQMSASGAVMIRANVLRDPVQPGGEPCEIAAVSVAGTPGLLEGPGGEVLGLSVAARSGSGNRRRCEGGGGGGGGGKLVRVERRPNPAPATGPRPAPPCVHRGPCRYIRSMGRNITKAPPARRGMDGRSPYFARTGRTITFSRCSTTSPGLVHRPV